MFYVAFTCAQDPPKCRSFCTMDYNPVCGTGPNGEVKTFSNLCVFDAQKCLEKLTGTFVTHNKNKENIFNMIF